MKSGGIATILLALIVAVLCFGEAFWKPNAKLFAPSGDGLKNYYTPAWYSDQDAGVWFSGMNYPEGEHIVYSDAQPLLVWTLKLIKPITGPIGPVMPGIMQWLMMLSVIGAAWFSYKLLDHYGVSALFAVPGAVLIAFGSPQIARWSGHFALGYCMVVPWIWWWAIRALKGGWGRMIMLVLLITALGFIHLYYLMIAGLMVGLYALSAVIYRRPDWPNSAQMLMAAALPLVFVTVFIKLTDTVDDRPVAPYGFTTYKADLEGVFLQQNGPIHKLLNKVVPVRQAQFEGLGYVGAPGVLMVFWWLNRLVRKVRSSRTANRRRRFWRSALPDDIGVWVGTAWLALIFAMAIPFRWNLDVLLDFIPPLKQFRSPGRAVWIFYHIWTVFTVIILHRGWKHWSHRGSGNLALGGITILALLWGWGNYQHASYTVRGAHVANPFTKSVVEPALEQAGFSATDFQAVIVMPWYHVGSEKLGILRGEGGMGHAFKTSLETGLPIVNVMMSRTSVEQTLDNCGLVSPYRENTNWLTSDDPRPFLTLYARQKAHDFENSILEKSEKLVALPEFDLYSTPAQAFDRTAQPINREGQAMKAIQEVRNGPLEVFRGRINMPVEGAVEIEGWFASDHRYAGYPYLRVWWLTAEGKAKVEFPTKSSTEISSDGWVRSAGRLELPVGETELWVEAIGKGIQMRDGFVRSIPNLPTDIDTAGIVVADSLSN